MIPRSRRSLIGTFVFVLVGLTAAGTVHAQCKVSEWYPGTVYYDTARMARETNAVVYGAARTVDREITPHLSRLDEEDEYGLTVFYGYSQIRNAASAPAFVTGCDDDGYRFIPYDLYAYNMAFGVRYEDFAAFYSASGAGGAFVASGSERAIQATRQWGMGFVNSYAAPVLGSQSVGVDGAGEEDQDPVAEEFNRIEIDYLVGAQFENDYVTARAGYLASSGVYGHAEVRAIRLFATSVLTNGFENLSYLTAGFSSLSSFSEELRDRIGRTALFARKLQYVSARLTQPATFEQVGPDTGSIDFWTGHIEQEDIADYFDAKVALAVAPRTLLHIGRVGVHTKYHHREGWLAEKPEVLEDDLKDGYASAGAELGIVNLPPMPYYAREGGAVFSATAEGRINLEEASIRFLYRYNDPDLLAMFPYAIGASAFTLNLNAIMR